MLTLMLGSLLALGPGYWLWLARLPRRSPLRREPDAWPRVDVLVALHDEEARVAAKLASLRALDYPPDRLRIVCVEGGSGDDTAARVADAARRDPRIELIRLPLADKILQLNAGLRACRADWVLVTDADAELPPETLRATMALAASDAALGVIGTTVQPERPHRLERTHWQLLNRLRRLEGARGFTSLVAGPCYAFRRDLLSQLPEDVIADDVHVALQAARRGRGVAIVDLPVRELRAPARLGELVRHKLRKSDAVLRELFRFLPQTREMASPAREMVRWRAAQLVIGPLALAAALVLGFASFPAWTAAFVLGALVLGRPFPIAALALVLGAVLLASLLAHPFSRQRARYPKVGVAS